MANRHPNAALDRIPMELLLITTEDMDRETLKTLTLVCKRLRLVFLPQTASRVTVTGNVPQMTSRLVSLLKDHPHSPSGPMSQYVKHVFFKPEPSQMITPSLRIPRLVGRFCRKATSLQKVTVTTYDFYKVLEAQAPQIKRLAFVDLREMPETGTNPRLATRFLNNVGINFKKLECLVLGEFLNPKFTWGQHQFRKATDKMDSNIMIMKVIMALKSMPKLTRFAFLLSEDTLGTRNYCNEPGEWNPWSTAPWANPDGMSEWYSKLVSNMSSLLPRLEQLCIRAQPSVYCHGVRKPGEPNMEVTWKTDQQEIDVEFENFFA
ncbi:hypothetical protein FOYG_14806 [Fusarium oxysporum NRRL 32931]|uniref:F-box domain-containing protein n=1 Tax=Fusarium oxysporum NRRL 32931 TaxID=660029 RepID=W9HKA7_FUSOX|nr:hypothetical protein FOYG_14806 [Fusarium oxysporum NRRL 32931]